MFGYWYRTLREAVRRWRVEIYSYEDGTWSARPLPPLLDRSGLRPPAFDCTHRTASMSANQKAILGTIANRGDVFVHEVKRSYVAAYGTDGGSKQWKEYELAIVEGVTRGGRVRAFRWLETLSCEKRRRTKFGWSAARGSTWLRSKPPIPLEENRHVRALG